MPIKTKEHSSKSSEYQTPEEEYAKQLNLLTELMMSMGEEDQQSYIEDIVKKINALDEIPEYKEKRDQLAELQKELSVKIRQSIQLLSNEDGLTAEENLIQRQNNWNERAQLEQKNSELLSVLNEVDGDLYESLGMAKSAIQYAKALKFVFCSDSWDYEKIIDFIKSPDKYLPVRIDFTPKKRQEDTEKQTFSEFLDGEQPMISTYLEYENRYNQILDCHEIIKDMPIPTEIKEQYGLE